MSLAVFALISVELLVLISSQFMSTVLISDFSESRFKMAINSTTWLIPHFTWIRTVIGTQLRQLVGDLLNIPKRL